MHYTLTEALDIIASGRLHALADAYGLRPDEAERILLHGAGRPAATPAGPTHAPSADPPAGDTRAADTLVSAEALAREVGRDRTHVPQPADRAAA